MSFFLALNAVLLFNVKIVYMQKITFLICGFLLLSMDVTLIYLSIQETKRNHYASNVFKHSSLTIQDKNLIKGNWQKDNSAVELHISKILKNGGLEVNYLNSKFIFVEKAGWTESSDILRLFVIYRQDDDPGYSLSLNYLAEKDLLVGVYVDGLDKRSYDVTFRRIR